MKFILTALIMSTFCYSHAQEVDLDRNSYGAWTLDRDISLYEEEGGALLIDTNNIQCFLSQKSDLKESERAKHLIRKGTTLIFGEYQVTGDHSSGVGVSWQVLNSPQIDALDCWLDVTKEGLTLIEILEEIKNNPY